MKIVIIDYGAGNVFSVLMALKRLGYEAVVSGDADEIRSADRVIFPGVGQASAAMEQLRASGLDRVIPELKMPVLGVCLGMQLMCRSTEEENTHGLGIFPLDVQKITGNYKIPHMGWNNITGLKTGLFKGIAENSRMYFVHSYYLKAGREEDVAATTEYSTLIHAAVEHDNVFACQFHPEKSSEIGLKILKNFVEL